MDKGRGRGNRDTYRQKGYYEQRQKGRGYYQNPNYQPIQQTSYSNSGNGQQNYQGNNTFNMAPFQGQDPRHPGNLGFSQPGPVLDPRWQNPNQGNGYRNNAGQNDHQGQQQQHQGQHYATNPAQQRQSETGEDDFYN